MTNVTTTVALAASGINWLVMVSYIKFCLIKFVLIIIGELESLNQDIDKFLVQNSPEKLRKKMKILSIMLVTVFEARGHEIR